MKTCWIAVIILFLMTSSSCSSLPPSKSPFPSITGLPSQVSTVTETKESQSTVVYTIAPTVKPTSVATKTPLPKITPIATPVYEIYQPITTENAKSAQIGYTIIPTSRRGEIYDLEFSPSGGLLAFVNELGDLKMWHFAQDGQRISLLNNQLDVLNECKCRIQNVAFSPDGKSIADGGSSGSLVIRDLETGNILHRGTVDFNIDDLVYSPDNSIIALTGNKWENGGWKHIIQLRNASDANLIATLNGYPGWWNDICSLAISSDGKVLAAGFCEYQMMVWDIKNGYKSLGKVTGQYAFECPGHCRWPNNEIEFMPNSTILASGTDNLGIPLIDVISRRLFVQMSTRREIENSSAVSGYDVTDIAFSPDGSILAIAAEQEIQLRNTTTNELLYYFETPEGNNATKIAFSPDGFLIAVALYGGNIIIIGVSV